MKRRLLWLFVVLFTVFNTSTGFAQSRQYIRDAIDDWGGCRNVAITKYNGDLALNERNAYAASDCPQGLVDELKRLNEEGSISTMFSLLIMVVGLFSMVTMVLSGIIFQAHSSVSFVSTTVWRRLSPL